MSIQSELASMYELMLRKGASEDTARVVATALCRELVPDNDDVAICEGVSRAIAVGAQRAAFLGISRRARGQSS